MSNYKDVEQLWERRNQEDKEKGINAPKVTPDSIDSVTKETEELSMLLTQRRLTDQIIAGIIDQKFAEVEIPEETRKQISSLAITGGIPFDELDSFIEERISEFLSNQKQAAVQEQEEKYEPLKLEHAEVDTDGLEAKKAQFNKDNKAPTTNQPIPHKANTPQKNVGEGR